MSPKKALDLTNDATNIPFTRGKNYLLVIGIDEYENCAKLNNAVGDAKALVELLQTEYQFDEERTYCYFDNDASWERIDEAFDLCTDKVKAPDNLLIYFSGHGHFEPKTESGYWIPVDAKYKRIQDYYSYDRLAKRIKGIKSQHTFLIVDSCYSGAFLARKMRSSLERLERDPSRWILASGRNEVVPDGKIGGHSPFAEKLIETLVRYAGDGIPVMELALKVTTSVIRNARQTPIASPLKDVGDQGGQFIFWPRNKIELSKISHEQNIQVILIDDGSLSRFDHLLKIRGIVCHKVGTATDAIELLKNDRLNSINTIIWNFVVQDSGHARNPPAVLDNFSNYSEVDHAHSVIILTDEQSFQMPAFPVRQGIHPIFLSRKNFLNSHNISFESLYRLIIEENKWIVENLLVPHIWSRNWKVLYRWHREAMDYELQEDRLSKEAEKWVFTVKNNPNLIIDNWPYIAFLSRAKKHIALESLDNFRTIIYSRRITLGLLLLKDSRLSKWNSNNNELWNVVINILRSGRISRSEDSYLDAISKLRLRRRFSSPYDQDITIEEINWLKQLEQKLAFQNF